ncbi:hypothetical protein ACEPAI_9874 [Sanghuangporus weigelae]
MLTDTLVNSNILWVCAALSAVVLVGHLAFYLIDSHHIRASGITGPLLARFSDAWLGWVQAHGHRSQIVHDLHKQHGTFVRLAPNHVSISDPDAIRIVNGHGIGTTKSNFYNAFVAISRSIFNTRSQEEHARKRKAVAHVFSPKSVLEFEPYIRSHVAELLEQWDKLCEGGRKGSGWHGRHGRVWFNCMPWFNFWAFDVIGDLAFGSPFGMICNAKYATPVAVDQETTMAEYGREKTNFEESSELVHAIKEVPAIEILNGRSKYSASLGVLPLWVGPGYYHGMQTGRIAFPTDRFLIAGSDSVSNSLCVITYYLAANPLVQEKLQKELDKALGIDNFEDPVLTYANVKNLPYLEAVVNEAMRVHSTAGLGLPRVVPVGGLTACVGRNLAALELLIIISSNSRRYDVVVERPNVLLDTKEGFIRKPNVCRIGMKLRAA